MALLMSAPHDLRHVRLSGFLRMMERGPILECRDGAVWRIRCEEDLAAFANAEVIVEGTPSGPDLTLLWIGPAPAGTSDRTA